MFTYILGFVMIFGLPFIMPALLLHMAGLSMKKTVIKDNERIEMLDFKKSLIVSLACWIGLYLIYIGFQASLNY